ncbi:MAG: hypothetical protein AAFV07_14785, partial [Bacteroidota bacterium]
MEVNWITLVFLAGAFQALVLLIGINVREPLQGIRKRLVSGLLLTVFLIILYYATVLAGNETMLPYLDSLGSAAWMALFPLFFLISKVLTEQDWTPGWQALLLFPLTIIFLVEGLITTLGVKFWLYQQVSYPLFLDIWMAYFFGTGFVFLWLSLKQARRHSGAPFTREIIWAAYGFLVLL